MIFINYLLDKLRFVDDNFRNEYLMKIHSYYRDFVSLDSKEIKYDRHTGKLIYPSDHKYKKYTIFENRLFPTSYNLVDFLLLECDIKSNKLFKPVNNSLDYISATDISNFTYCPVSWAISKSLSLPKVISTQIGSMMHEQHKLLNYVTIRRPDGKIVPSRVNLKNFLHSFKYNEYSEMLFDELFDSEAVFIGSNKENHRKYFKGSDDIYIGQPDYIFYNYKKKKYYVVEEKFTKIRKPPKWNLPHNWCVIHGYNPVEIEQERQQMKFYNNHLNQLRSYIYGIRGFGKLHGYLVYWRYYFIKNSVVLDTDFSIKIDQVRSRLISGEHTEDQKIISYKYLQIKQAIKDKGGNFYTSERNPAKCAGCVYNILCGHKTGQYKYYTIPYDHSFLKLESIPFPIKLKKTNSMNDFIY